MTNQIFISRNVRENLRKDVSFDKITSQKKVELYPPSLPLSLSLSLSLFLSLPLSQIFILIITLLRQIFYDLIENWQDDYPFKHQVGSVNFALLCGCSLYWSWFFPINFAYFQLKTNNTIFHSYVCQKKIFNCPYLSKYSPTTLAW